MGSPMNPQDYSVNGSQFMYLPPYGVGAPGSTVGGAPPEPFFRDIFDARRSMWRRTPDSQYPDGYLGTITSRRGDRVLDNLKGRLNERQYQRGIHKGERIDSGDYFWPEKFQPTDGLKCETKGIHWTPVGILPPKINGETALSPRGTWAQQALGDRRQEQLRKLAPAWRW